METFIYELNRNNIPFYIGKTTDVKMRKQKHQYKKGKDVNLIVIDSVKGTDKSIWKPVEQLWISLYQGWGFNLTNKNDGGNGRKPTGKKLSRREIDKRYNEKHPEVKKRTITKEYQREYWEKYKRSPKYQEYLRKQRIRYYKNKNK
jgi:hypothetical protein